MRYIKIRASNMLFAELKCKLKYGEVLKYSMHHQNELEA